MRKLRIGNHVITDASKAFVIAEIGSNHGGDMDLAERLVRAAAACGCDAVKFQKRNNRELYTEGMYNKPYDNENSYGKTYGLHREALELDVEQHLFLKDLAESLDMIYFSTPFDFTSVDEMEMLGVGLYKVASGDIYSYPLLKRIGETKKPVILSTGGADIPEIRAALDHIGHSNVAILHCVASYPCSPEQCNLMAMNTLSRAFPDHIIGLSDHYGGILSSVAAWMMGGRIFEKHFKIDGCRGTSADCPRKTTRSIKWARAFMPSATLIRMRCWTSGTCALNRRVTGSGPIPGIMYAAGGHCGPFVRVLASLTTI